MPERSFGRTVRYRRTKLGLSQARLAELVGRSPATVRSWESERSVPNDIQVLATLSAILGVDERLLFDKAGVTPPEGFELETSPTLEQALASISPDGEVAIETTPTVEEVLASLAPEEAAPEDEPPAEDADGRRAPTPAPRPEAPPRPQLRAVPRPLPQPAPESATVTTLRPVAVREASYIEDPAQRQFYQVRTLASVVGLVAIAIALLWAVGNGLDALGRWWNDFFSGLRL